MADILVISGNSSLGATYVGGIVPTNADRILLDATSGQFTIDATLACRSIDCTGYTNTITHNAGIAINIGDATSAVGNLALKFVNGMIYNKLHPATCAINFISTNATQQTVEFGGNTMGNLTFKGVASSYLFNSDLECTRYYATIDIQNGTVNTNGKIITTGVFTETTTAAKTITLGASVINCYPITSDSFSWANATGLTITANTAIVNINRNPSNTNGATFVRIPSGLSNYLTINCRGGGIYTMASAGSTAVCKDFNIWGAAAINGIDDRLQMNASFAVTGMVNIYGFSADRRLRVHNGGDFYLPNATALYCEYTDFSSVNIPTYTVDLSLMLGGTGNFGGNTGIIFTTGITCYWYQTIAGIKNWTDGANWFLGSGGTGGQARRPLAQDNAIFDLNSFQVAGCIVRGAQQGATTNSVMRLARDVNWTGALNNPTWDIPCDCTLYGSLTLTPNMSMTTYSTDFSFISMAGTATAGEVFTLNMAGTSFPIGGIFISFSTTLDDLTMTGDFVGNANNTTLFSVGCKTFNMNGFNITTGTMTHSCVTSTLGSGLIKLKGSGTVFNGSSTTVSATTGTIEIESQNTNSKTFTGGGKVYGNLKLSGNFNDTTTFTGNNGFTNLDITKTSAFTALFTASSTTTFTGTVTKTTGSLWTLASTTTSIFTWSKASGTVTFVDAIISKSTASGGATWTANTNSVDGGGNTGWTGFVTANFTWKNTLADGDGSNGANWEGGIVPSTTDVAIFSGAFNQNCSGLSQPVLGIIMTLGFTGTLTSNVNIGTTGIEVNGGTLTIGSTGIQGGGLKQTGGTVIMPVGEVEFTPQGSTKRTINVSGGTFTHTSGKIWLNGVGEAIVVNTSGRPLFDVNFGGTSTVSGTFFMDGSTSNATPILNADVSIKGNLSGSSFPSGTGIFRMIMTGTIQSSCARLPNLQFNGSGTVNLNVDLVVDGTTTFTTLGSMTTGGGFKLICKGNISCAATTIGGTANTSIEGSLPEQTITGTGIMAGDVTINKPIGLVKLISNNIQPCGVGKNFTVTSGQFSTNNFNIVFINNLVVTESTAGVFYQTALSNVFIGGSLTGRKILRQKLYANGLSIGV